MFFFNYLLRVVRASETEGGSKASKATEDDLEESILDNIVANISSKSSKQSFKDIWLRGGKYEKRRLTESRVIHLQDRWLEPSNASGLDVDMYVQAILDDLVSYLTPSEPIHRLVKQSLEEIWFSALNCGLKRERSSEPEGTISSPKKPSAPDEEVQKTKEETVENTERGQGTKKRKHARERRPPKKKKATAKGQLVDDHVVSIERTPLPRSPRPLVDVVWEGKSTPNTTVQNITAPAPPKLIGASSNAIDTLKTQSPNYFNTTSVDFAVERSCEESFFTASQRPERSFARRKRRVQTLDSTSEKKRKRLVSVTESHRTSIATECEEEEEESCVDGSSDEEEEASDGAFNRSSEKKRRRTGVSTPSVNKRTDLVRFFAIGPSKMIPNSTSIVEIWAVLNENREIFEKDMRRKEDDVLGQRGPAEIRRKTQLVVKLNIPDKTTFAVAVDQDEILWIGHDTNTQFQITCLSTAIKDQTHILRASVFVRASGSLLPLADIHFRICTCASMARKNDADENANDEIRGFRRVPRPRRVRTGHGNIDMIGARQKRSVAMFAAHADKSLRTVQRYVNAIRSVGVDVTFIDVRSSVEDLQRLLKRSDSCILIWSSVVREILRSKHKESSYRQLTAMLNIARMRSAMNVDEFLHVVCVGAIPRDVPNCVRSAMHPQSKIESLRDDDDVENYRPVHAGVANDMSSYDVSRIYFETHLLDFDCRMTNGFFDGGRGRGWKRLPSLAYLNSSRFPIDERREIIVVDARHDTKLASLVRKCQEGVKKCSSDIEVCRGIANVVSTHFGGYMDENNSTKLMNDMLRNVVRVKRHMNTNVVPLCSISAGVCRHRSILFKYLVDQCCHSHDDTVSLRCRLVRGQHEHWGHAWNVVLCSRTDMYVVDLMRRGKDILFPITSPSAAFYRREGGGVGGESVFANARRSSTRDDNVSPDYGLPIVSPHELSLDHGRVLGEGAFGVVKLCNWRGLDVAVKILKSHVVSNDTFWKEIAIIAPLRHPHIISTLAICKKDPVAVVMEIMPFTLTDRLHRYKRKSCKRLTFQERGRILYHIALAIRFLHTHKPQKILHLDLKPDNVLLDRYLNARVCDFGLAHLQRRRVDVTSNIKGTPRYMSPEAFHGRLLEQTDTYSFGVVVWETLSEEQPWLTVPTLAEMIKRVCVRGERPSHPKGLYSSSMRSWIDSLWHQQPARRPRFDSIIKTLKSWNAHRV